MGDKKSLIDKGSAPCLPCLPSIYIKRVEIDIEGIYRVYIGIYTTEGI